VAREHPATPAAKSVASAAPRSAAPRKRGRPRRGEERQPAAKSSPLARQRNQTLAQTIREIPTACDRGTKCNAQGYKIGWNGYKLHLDTDRGALDLHSQKILKRFL